MFLNEDLMVARIANIAVAVAALTVCLPASARAQDVPGIEICTVEKTMERRTSCLQSNVDFLQKTINKLTSDHQQKLEAANRQIEALKGNVVALQKTADDLQKRMADDQKKKAEMPAAAKDAAKDGAK
jgi:septal ring factor EnvC (AmiA/AmiB activator)